MSRDNFTHHVAQIAAILETPYTKSTRIVWRALYDVDGEIAAAKIIRQAGKGIIVTVAHNGVVDMMPDVIGLIDAWDIAAYLRLADVAPSNDFWRQEKTESEIITAYGTPHREGMTSNRRTLN